MFVYKKEQRLKWRQREDEIDGETGAANETDHETTENKMRMREDGDGNEALIKNEAVNVTATRMKKRMVINPK